MVAWTAAPYATALSGLTVEEVGHELDDTRNTRGTTDQDDFMHVGFVDLRITQNLLHRLESATEEILAKFLETGSSEGSVEVDAFIQRVYLDGGLGGGR